MPSRILDFPVFDADNHMYETTEAFTKFLPDKYAGLIDYVLGRIRVLNRGGLERRSCECYAVVKKEYDRLLPDKLAA